MDDTTGQRPLAGTGALVTGGGGGIGLACAKRLAADGATVTICGRTEDKLVAAAGEIGAVAGPRAGVRHVVADVTDEASVEAAVAAAGAGVALRAVVASAGGSSTVGPITQVDVGAFRATLEMNVVGTFLALKHSARSMVAAGGGSFVGISSIASSNTHRWFGPYGPAKGGIEKLCLMAADELRQRRAGQGHPPRPGGHRARGRRYRRRRGAPGLPVVHAARAGGDARGRGQPGASWSGRDRRGSPGRSSTARGGTDSGGGDGRGWSRWASFRSSSLEREGDPVPTAWGRSAGSDGRDVQPRGDPRVRSTPPSRPPAALRPPASRLPADVTLDPLPDGGTRITWDSSLAAAKIPGTGPLFVAFLKWFVGDTARRLARAAAAGPG